MTDAIHVNQYGYDRVEFDTESSSTDEYKTLRTLSDTDIEFIVADLRDYRFTSREDWTEVVMRIVSDVQ